MKTKVFSLSFILLTLAFMGCDKEDTQVTPSSQVTSQNHAITDFAELIVSDPFEVYVQFSDTEQELRIEASSNLHSLIEVEQRNNELTIKLKGNHQIQGTPVLKIYLTTQNIKSITAQGATHVYLQDEWLEDEVEVKLVGASSLEGTITTQELTADLTGASILTIEGSTQVFDLKAEGASEMGTFDFETDKLIADLSGACQVELTVNQELDIKATGASTIHYRGEGVIVSQDLSGGSQIIKE
jgi:hypothetical protein